MFSFFRTKLKFHIFWIISKILSTFTWNFIIHKSKNCFCGFSIWSFWSSFNCNYSRLFGIITKLLTLFTSYTFLIFLLTVLLMFWAKYKNRYTLWNILEINYQLLTLATLGYFCNIMSLGENIVSFCLNTDRILLLIWSLAQLYFVMLQKKKLKKFGSYADDNVTNYVKIYRKLC